MATSNYESNNFPVSNEASESISGTAATQQEVNQEFKNDLQDKILFFEQNWNLETRNKFDKLINSIKNLSNFTKKFLGTGTLITEPVTISLSEEATNFDEIWFNQWSSQLSRTIFLKIPTSEFKNKNKQIINMFTPGIDLEQKATLLTIEIIDSQNLLVSFFNMTTATSNDQKFDVWGIKYEKELPAAINSFDLQTTQTINLFKKDKKDLETSFSDFIQQNILQINKSSSYNPNSNIENSTDETDNLIVSDPSLESISKTAQYQQKINEEFKNRLKIVELNIENVQKIKNALSKLKLNYYHQNILAEAIDVSAANSSANAINITLSDSSQNYNELALKFYSDTNCWWFYLPIDEQTNFLTSVLTNKNYKIGEITCSFVDDLNLSVYFKNVLELTDWKLDIYGVILNRNLIKTESVS